MNAINWMAKQKTGDDKSKSALFWLAFHMNDKTGECFPSISTLQAEMEVKSDNTVRSALRRLRDAGLISWERETRDGLTVKTKYRLHMHGSMTAGTSADKGTSTVERGTSTVEVGTSTIAGGVPQPLRTNMEIEQGINRERNKESSMRTSGTSSAIAAVASAQAQTLPTSFSQSSNSQNHSEAGIAGKDSLPNASERSVAAHRDRPDKTRQNDAGCSQNASTRISGACPENEPPPMSDEDLENLFADAQLDIGAKAEEPTGKTKRKRSSNAQKPESVSGQVWNDFTALRTKRRAPITETALKGIQREAEKAGITLEEALSTCCERGWQGFKAEWYRREKLEQKNASKAEYQLPSNDDWDNFDTAHYA